MINVDVSVIFIMPGLARCSLVVVGQGRPWDWGWEMGEVATALYECCFHCSLWHAIILASYHRWISWWPIYCEHFLRGQRISEVHLWPRSTAGSRNLGARPTAEVPRMDAAVPTEEQLRKSQGIRRRATPLVALTRWLPPRWKATWHWAQSAYP